MGERNSPPRMDCAVQQLAKPISEQTAYELKRRFERSQSVAMGQEETFSHNILHNVAVYDGYAYFIPKVVEKPYIVVSYEPCYFHSAVGK